MKSKRIHCKIIMPWMTLKFSLIRKLYARMWFTIGSYRIYTLRVNLILHFWQDSQKLSPKTLAAIIEGNCFWKRLNRNYWYVAQYATACKILIGCIQLTDLHFHGCSMFNQWNIFEPFHIELACFYFFCMPSWSTFQIKSSTQSHLHTL